MSPERFGRLGDADIWQATLRSGRIEARIITWGAVLRDLIVHGAAGPQRVVLGLERLEDYLAYSPYFGAIVGRYANRIGDARFRLGGHDVELVANENRNELHGGPLGFGRRVWSLLGQTDKAVHLALVSEDGDMGFPGRLFATATYEIVGEASLRITLQAFSDEATPVNLTTHSYYNLDGSPDVRDHELSVAADFITPTDEGLIPTGAIAPVAGTPYDFRRARPIRHPTGQLYDTNFVLRRERSAEPTLAHAATLSSSRTGLAMELWTSEPGLQVYDGHKIKVPVPGLSGQPYGAFAGMPLEPQRFPDAPNHSHFPPCTLSPGEVSRQLTELRFRLPG